MDSTSKQPSKKHLCNGAFPDDSLNIFGIDVLSGRNDDIGVFVEPGFYMPESWSDTLFKSMLRQAQDNELKSKDKNG